MDNTNQLGVCVGVGELSCTRCHRLYSEKNGRVLKHGPINLDPYAFGWGTREPRIMVLGFSKGTNQSRELTQYLVNGKTKPDFLAIPFASPNGVMRNRLTEMLNRIGLIKDGTRMEDYLDEGNHAFHWGSIIRCGVSVDVTKPQKNGSLQVAPTVKMDEILKALPIESALNETFSNCVAQHLSGIHKPMIVVLLGNKAEYVTLCYEMLSLHYPNLKWISPTGQSPIRQYERMAYGTDTILFIHLPHPSSALTDKQFERILTDNNKHPKMYWTRQIIGGFAGRHPVIKTAIDGDGLNSRQTTGLSSTLCSG